MDNITKRPHTTKELFALVERIKQTPEQYRRKPFQILDNIYYVGNKWVGAYLIDTGEGLILIDSNFTEVMPLLFDNIRTLGFRTENIKLLLLSHGHFDHIGGAAQIQARSHCKTYFPQGDTFMLTKRRDLLFGQVDDFTIDEYYDYHGTICLGNTEIRPILSPGHTMGCTSLLIRTVYQGKPYQAAVHGGLGTNGLTKRELQEAGLPIGLQEAYLHSLCELSKLNVDIFLPLHNSYYDILGLAQQDTGDHGVFIRPGDWKKSMEGRIAAFQQLLAEEK